MATREDIVNLMNNKALLRKLVQLTMDQADPQRQDFLTPAALYQLMKQVAAEVNEEDPSQEDSASVFAALDKDQDGKIDEQEFEDFVMIVLNHILDSGMISKLYSTL